MEEQSVSICQGDDGSMTGKKNKLLYRRLYLIYMHTPDVPTAADNLRGQEKAQPSVFSLLPPSPGTRSPSRNPHEQLLLLLLLAVAGNRLACRKRNDSILFFSSRLRDLCG